MLKNHLGSTMSLQSIFRFSLPLYILITLFGTAVGAFTVFFFLAFVSEDHHFIIGSMTVALLANVIFSVSFLRTVLHRYLLITIYVLVWIIVFMLALQDVRELTLVRLIMYPLIPVSALATLVMLSVKKQQKDQKAVL